MNIVVIFVCVALQVHTLAEEKEKHVTRIQELEDNVTELLSSSGRASKMELPTAEWSWITLSCCANASAQEVQVGLMLGRQMETR